MKNYLSNITESLLGLFGGMLIILGGILLVALSGVIGILFSCFIIWITC